MGIASICSTKTAFDVLILMLLCGIELTKLRQTLIEIAIE